VNFWWNPIQQVEPKDAAEKTDGAKISLKTKMVPKRALPHHGGYEPVEKEAIEVPDNIQLRPFFSSTSPRQTSFNLELKIDDNITSAMCLACGGEEHEHENCPYLGHYEVHRIIGQMCCWENYQLKN
jgi:hypothetical protein